MDQNQDLKFILSQKDSLNLEMGQKRLILKAMIKSNFRIKKAFEINCNGSFYTYDRYDKIFRKTFTGGVKELKKSYIKQFNMIEDEFGNLIKKV